MLVELLRMDGLVADIASDSEFASRFSVSNLGVKAFVMLSKISGKYAHSTDKAVDMGLRSLLDIIVLVDHVPLDGARVEVLAADPAGWFDLVSLNFVGLELKLKYLFPTDSTIHFILLGMLRILVLEQRGLHEVLSADVAGLLGR